MRIRIHIQQELAPGSELSREEALNKNRNILTLVQQLNLVK